MQNKEEIRPLIEDSTPKAIVLSRKYEEYPKGTGVDKKELFMEDIANLPAPNSLPDFEVSSDDLAAIVYTSGTTGIPKGVMLSHSNIMSNVQSAVTKFDLGPEDNWLTALPLHHTFETTAGFLAPFYTGGTKTFPETLKSHAILKNLQETGVTILGSVPLFYKLLYEGVWRRRTPTRDAMQKPPGDHELVQEARAGSRAAAELLIRRYERQVYRVCLTMARNGDDALDKMVVHPAAQGSGFADCAVLIDDARVQKLRNEVDDAGAADADGTRVADDVTGHFTIAYPHVRYMLRQVIYRCQNRDS